MIDKKNWYLWEKKPMEQPQGGRKYKRNYWSRLGIRMTVSYMLVTVGAVFIGELSLILILFILQASNASAAHSSHLTSFLHNGLQYDLIKSILLLLLITLPIGTFFSFITTRRLVQRIESLVKATTQFAGGDYSSRVLCSSSDEVGLLEQHFNLMVAQLAESTEQRQALVEQNSRFAERSRIARDLHDSIKQHIFAVSMQIGAALSHLEQDSQATRTHLLEADTLTYGVQQELTNLIHELRPSSLQAKGLVGALREYIATWSRQNTIAAETLIEEIGILPASIEEALFKVAQEALSNVARHSSATIAGVELTCKDAQVTLTIIDNGRGFDPLVTETHGLGLQSMRERIEGVAGSIQLQSKSGKGTQVIVGCPLTGL
jgi:two-component system, NarL family, sensor histidine kinase LiaS